LRASLLGLSALAAGGILQACEWSTLESSRVARPAAETTEAGTAEAGDSPPVTSKHTFTQALQYLIDGNNRFVSGQLLRPGRDIARRTEVYCAQTPFAAILTCSDSRVPPEILFDLGLGDIFIVRTAGNVAGPIALGSLEYAVEHLGVPLLVVLGHQKCGAVTAAASGGEAKGHIASVVEEIAPAVEKARSLTGDLVTNAIDMNILEGVEKLKTTAPILSEYVEKGWVQVVGARYDLGNGKVSWM
jgi:carbonic anhydrase